MGEKVKKLKKWQKIVIVVLIIVLVVVGGFFIFRDRIAKAVLDEQQLVLLNTYRDSQKILNYSDYDYKIYKVLYLKGSYMDYTDNETWDAYYNQIIYYNDNLVTTFEQDFSLYSIEERYTKYELNCKTNDKTLVANCTLTQEDLYGTDKHYEPRDQIYDESISNASQKPIVKFLDIDINEEGDTYDTCVDWCINTRESYSILNPIKMESVELPSYILFLFG